MAFRIKPTEQCQENYQPSQRAIRRFWLGTKKRSYSIGGSEFPGLIDYNEDLWPVIAFTVGLFFEIVGLILLFRVGLDWRAAVALGLTDIFFAILRHFPRSKICELKNVLMVSPAGPPQAAIQRRINRYRLLEWLLSVPIILIALIKIVNFIGFRGGLDPSGLLVIISYVIVAVIHLTATGYFVWWLGAELCDVFEHRSYKRVLDEWGTKNPGVFPPYPPPIIGAPHEIHGPQRYGPIVIRNLVTRGYVVDRHVLINDGLLQQGGLPQDFFRRFDQSDAHASLKCTAALNDFLSARHSDSGLVSSYTLFTYGLLTDEQVRRFCSLLPISDPILLQSVAKELLRHQLSIVGIPVPVAPSVSQGSSL